MNTLFKASGLPRGEISTKKVSRKIQQQAQLAARNATSDFTALYIVFENVEYRHTVFIHQPLGALKKKKWNSNDNMDNQRKEKKTFFVSVIEAKMFSVNSPFDFDFIVYIQHRKYIVRSIAKYVINLAVPFYIHVLVLYVF